MNTDSNSNQNKIQKSMTNFEFVGEFNENFGHPKHSILQKTILETDQKLIKFRLSLISEEISELEQAIKERDIEEVIDALADILYVVYGMGQVTGTNLDYDFYDHYCHLLPSNASRSASRGVSKNCLTNFEIIKKIMYDINPMPDRINRQIFTEYSDMVEDSFGLVKNEFSNLEIVVEQDLVRVSQSLVSLLFAVYKMGYNMGINLDQAFKIVHLSNMSKLCQNEEQAIETIEHYKTLDGFRETDVRYRLSTVNPNYYIIYNSDTGKILKSKYFTVPKFGTMFEFPIERKPVIITLI